MAGGACLGCNPLQLHLIPGYKVCFNTLKKLRVGGVVTCVGDQWRIGPTFVVIQVRARVFKVGSVVFVDCMIAWSAYIGYLV